jgi:hypothetical protein
MTLLLTLLILIAGLGALYAGMRLATGNRAWGRNYLDPHDPWSSIPRR